MKRQILAVVLAVFTLSTVLYVSDAANRDSSGKKVTILFTHALEGCLEPCG